MTVSRAEGTRYCEEILERILDGGMVLDGLSHLVALAGSVKITAQDSGPRAGDIRSVHSFPRPTLPPLASPNAATLKSLSSLKNVKRTTLLLPSASTVDMRATRLIHGDFYADILPDRKHPGKVWLYVVQRSGSKDVLAMGSSRSESEAEADALETIRDLRKAVAVAAGF